MWSRIRDLVTQTAEAVGVELPELPDVSAITDQLTGTAGAMAETVTQGATETLATAAETATSVADAPGTAGADAVAGGADGLAAGA